MNFLDPTDITAGTPPPEQTQSLEEEVNEVIGTLGRFWGDFRKQSQTALETARKDLGGVVAQAQQGLSQLTAETPNTTESESEPTPTPPAATESVDESTTPRNSSPVAGPSSGTIFSRLQAALPPNLVATVQSQIPDSLKQTDLAQMRNTLSSEFQRVQGLTRVQAEEFAHKSEALLREAIKEAGDALRDAVKVVPPEEAGSNSGKLLWDGADMWMLPFDTASDASASGKGKEKAGRQTADAQLAVATRAEALLKRLKHDSEIIKHDPETDAKELYAQWLATSMTGGIDGEEWTVKITAVMNETADGLALKANHDALVPTEMTRETFWQRYFFRVHQIEQEEEKRKALLQRSAENEEDFSWEDEEEPLSTTKESAAPNDKPTQEVLSVPSSETTTPATTSPRESSEDSFDVVSDNQEKPKQKTAESEDGDSDWE
ncbi:hypothetical protein FB45DRAFT_892633 [Roridomyces roridus]|uniref:BSD domain-containing protein n=1 Tax=Roridomyces roridus TaxID=1738132 RepID=A0AAD7CF04_9AGAR|nr:hypothetical protein FB45DRAFT_892633 [Roridomyces roridus]